MNLELFDDLEVLDLCKKYFVYFWFFHAVPSIALVSAYLVFLPVTAITCTKMPNKLDCASK